MKFIKVKLVITLLLFIFILLTAYQPVNKEKNHLITFDIENLNKTTNISLSDIGVADIEYIPLETSEHSLISNIKQTIFGEDILLVSNYDKVLEFKTDGSFVTQIGKKGKGLLEFETIIDVRFNEKTKNIYIASIHENKIYIYSKKGSFIKTIPCPERTWEFNFIERYILCYSDNTTGKIINSYNLIDIDGKTIKSFPNLYQYRAKEPNVAFMRENLFYRFNNTICKKEIYNDTVYAFENYVFRPKFVLNHGKKTVTVSAREILPPRYIIDNFVTPWKLFEFGDNIYYEFSLYPKGYVFIGSKSNNSQLLTDEEIVNDLDGGPGILFESIKDDNTIISWVNAADLKTHIESETFKNSTPLYPKKKKELEKLANSLVKNDNPVLILLKLKE